MKRSAIIKKLQQEAKRQGKTFEVRELTRHTSVRVGESAHTLGRHREIGDKVARKFFDQFGDELGKGWWR